MTDTPTTDPNDVAPAVAELDTIVSLVQAPRLHLPVVARSTAASTRSGTTGRSGVELKNNVKRAWWRAMVQERDDIVGLDAGILMHPQVWVTSGHVGSFSDPLVECATCHRRFRLDELPGAEDLSRDRPARPDASSSGSGLRCPDDGGPLSRAAPLQPHVQDVHGPGRGGRLGRLPAPGDRAGLVRQLQERPAVARARSCRSGSPRSASRSATRSAPATSSSGCASSSRWRCSTSSARTRPPPRRSRSGCRARRAWYERYGVTPARLRFREHAPDELAHYAKKAIDVEYRFPFGWKELEGIHNRGDFDLSQPRARRPARTSSTSTRRPSEHFIPWIVETAAGADRAAFTFLIDAYREEEVRGETRVVAARSTRSSRRTRSPSCRCSRSGPRSSSSATASRPTCKRDIDGRLRRHGRDRQALPPPGRDRHAVVRHGRRRLARGRRGDGPRPRLDDPGAGARSRA